MKSIVKRFLSYRYHHPRRLFSTNVVTGITKYDDDNSVKEENSEDNDKHLKKISIEEEVKDKELIKIENTKFRTKLLDLEKN